MPPRPEHRWSDAVSAAPFDPTRRDHWLVHVGSPLGISLLFHAALIGTFTLITWAVVQRSEDDNASEIVARIVAAPSAGEAGSLRFPAAQGGTPVQANPSPNAAPTPGLAELARITSPSPAPSVSEPSSATRQLGGLTLSRRDVVGSPGISGAAGMGLGTGGRDGSGPGPIGSLWGVGEGQRAQSVVYVVDRSGSFMEWVEAIDLELKRSLGLLSDDQSFNLIFLRDNKPQTFKGKLVTAVEANKREAFAWINTYPPAGGSNLTPAVKVGLSYKPDVMFIVVDADLFTSPIDNAASVTDRRELLTTIRLARRRKNTTVHVILMGPTEMPATADRAALRARLESLRRDTGDDAEIARTRLLQQLDLLDTVEELRKLPAESGGTLRYLNGDALMEQWRRTHSPR